MLHKSEGCHKATSVRDAPRLDSVLWMGYVDVLFLVGYFEVDGFGGFKIDFRVVLLSNQNRISLSLSP